MFAHLSVRAKITLWFSVSLVLISALTYFVVLSVGSQVIQRGIRDELIAAVEDNVDEVEFVQSLEQLDFDNDEDNYIEIGDGYLEIDDDFLGEVNQIYTAVYDSDGTFIFGINPVDNNEIGLAFQDSELREFRLDNIKYYLYDRLLEIKGVGQLWLRGIVSEKRGEVELTAVSRFSLIFLPGLLLIAILGGWLIAGRVLRPIRQISASAAQISRGDDLRARIELGKGNDELHQLADSFNAMFARLEESFRAQQQFTADASHELRTPVAVIMAQCELALETEHTVDEYVEALGLIEKQSTKMSRLIGDMLSFSRLELKAEQYEQEQIDFSGLIDTLCRDMALIRDKDICLQWTCEPGILCTGNRKLLSSLAANLISNAYKYGNQNGHIFVSLKQQGDQIVLSVKDDGIGIDQSEQSRIFDRFYQVDSSHSVKGSGLGLAMAKEIARFHNGQLNVRSTIGAGSEFIFVFPGLL